MHNKLNFMQSALKSKGVRWIAGGWIAFIGENVILSENREYLISRFGDDNYHAGYGLLSTLACSSIAYGYFKHGRGQGPTVRAPGLASKVAAILLQTLGLVGLSQLVPTVRSPFVSVPAHNSTPQSQQEKKPTFAVRCPMDFRPKDIPQDGIYGLERISRHATFWSFGSICLGKALTTVFFPEIVMFSFPAVFALIGGAHQDHRFLRGSGGVLTAEKYAKTSNIPFVAVLLGRQSLSDVYNELKLSNAAVAVSISLLFALRSIK